MTLPVSIDRQNCTSCGTCWDTCPDFFEEDPKDHFSRILERYRHGDSIADGRVPEELADCVKDAADSCPVQIITVS